MADRECNGGGLDFFDGLLLLFIGLKLTGQIDWSWWWVLSPVPIAFLMGGVIVIFKILEKISLDRFQAKYLAKPFSPPPPPDQAPTVA
jgi:hypothetical protein